MTHEHLVIEVGEAVMRLDRWDDPDKGRMLGIAVGDTRTQTMVGMQLVDDKLALLEDFLR